MIMQVENRKLYLASISPRRKELLQKLGIPFHMIAPTFEETPTHLSAKEESLYFAEQKARSVAVRCPHALIIGSDTLIECDGKKLGKPVDEADALQMLQCLSGKTHRLYTAGVLLNTQNGTIQKAVEEVRVTFKECSSQVLQNYVATGEPMGKAGAYAVQGAGKELIKKIEGDADAVIGLPVGVLERWMK